MNAVSARLVSSQILRRFSAFSQPACAVPSSRSRHTTAQRCAGYAGWGKGIETGQKICSGTWTRTRTRPRTKIWRAANYPMPDRAAPGAAATANDTRRACAALSVRSLGLRGLVNVDGEHNSPRPGQGTLYTGGHPVHAVTILNRFRRPENGRALYKVGGSG